MDMTFNHFLFSLGSIILLDIILGGDNAVVIGMASRQLPKHMQKKVMYLGTAGAVVIRIIMTLLAAYLLTIPYLQAVGGCMLLFIAFKLLKSNQTHTASPASSTSFAAAVRTIIAADAAMGIDNVLAVAGAAHGSLFLVLTGLTISIPIIVWGSQLTARLMDRFPFLIPGGAAILAYTSASLILHDTRIRPYFILYSSHWDYILPSVFIISILVYSKLTKE